MRITVVALRRCQVKYHRNPICNQIILLIPNVAAIVRKKSSKRLSAGFIGLPPLHQVRD